MIIKEKNIKDIKVELRRYSSNSIIPYTKLMPPSRKTEHEIDLVDGFLGEGTIVIKVKKYLHDSISRREKYDLSRYTIRFNILGHSYEYAIPDEVFINSDVVTCVLLNGGVGDSLPAKRLMRRAHSWEKPAKSSLHVMMFKHFLWREFSKTKKA